MLITLMVQVQARKASKQNVTASKCLNIISSSNYKA